LRPELIFQSIKYGPISAAISAMMKAIDSPSSVVCTGSPFERNSGALAPHGAWRASPPGEARHRDDDA